MNLTSQDPSAQTVPVLEMLLAAFSFATMAAIAHNLGAEVPWPILAFVRILSTFIIAVGIARYAGFPLFVFGPPVMWLRSVAGTLGLMFTFYSLTHLPITDALTIQHTSPLWVALILAVMHRKFPPLRVIAAVLCAFAGVVMMEHPSFNDASFAMGVACLSAMCTATAVVSLRNLGGYSSISVVAHYCGFASLAMLALCFVPVAGVRVSDLHVNASWWWVLPMGIFGTLGQVYMTKSIGRGDTQLLTLVGLSVVAFAAFYDFILWGMRIDAAKVLGIAMILTGVVLCSWSPPGKKAIDPAKVEAHAE